PSHPIPWSAPFAASRPSPLPAIDIPWLVPETLAVQHFNIALKSSLAFLKFSAGTSSCANGPAYHSRTTRNIADPIRWLWAFALVICGAASTYRAAAQDLAVFEKRLTEYHMPSGLTFLIYERSEAPVVSFFTYVDVGAAQEVPGITGLAHMFEHMAFKGTSRIGTSNYSKEKAVLDKIDRAYHTYDQERHKTRVTNAEKL